MCGKGDFLGLESLEIAVWRGLRKRYGVRSLVMHSIETCLFCRIKGSLCRQRVIKTDVRGDVENKEMIPTV